MSHIPPRAACRNLIQRYLETVGGTHRLFHLPTLHQELIDFWSGRWRADYDWLAQFFMILALGYRASDCETQPSLSESTITSLCGVDKFILAAQACLKKAGYMLLPKNTTIRALCLMTIAIQTSGYSCRNMDACGPWIEKAVSHCIRLAHHKASGPNFDPSEIDAFIAKRLWTTVGYLQLQQCMNSGTPLLLRPSDFEYLPLLDMDDEDVQLGIYPSSTSVSQPSSTRVTWTEGTYQVLLAKSLYAAVDIVSRANSSVDTNQEMNYASVSEYDALFRGLLRTVGDVYSNTTPTRDFRDSWRTYQRVILETFFRRLLLILHLPFVQPYQPQSLKLGITPPSGSHWALLDCSLAILVAQRQLLERAPDDGPPGTTQQFYEELLKQDFFIAALLAGIQVDSECQAQYRQQSWKDISDAHRSHSATSESNCSYSHTAAFASPQVPPRDTIIQTLRCCQSIWARSLHGNLEEKCNIWVYLVLGKMIDMLNLGPGCLTGGSPSPTDDM